MMTIKKNIILLGIICFTLLKTAVGQTVIPPTGDEQSQVDIASGISNYTGAFNYSILLFTIKEGNITVPVSLNYTGTGVRVNDVPSWCGLGWAIDAGGLITRTIVGQPDETPGTGYIDYLTKGHLSVTNQTDAASHTYKQLTEQSQIDSLAKGLIDGEPDIYNFSVPGASGKILYDANGHFVCSPLQHMQVNEDSAISIVLSRNPILLNSNNCIYQFGGMPSETITETPYVDNPNNPEHLAYRWDTVYSTNAFYLGRIASIQGNEVDFTYNNFYYGASSDNFGQTYFRPTDGGDNMFAINSSLITQYGYSSQLQEIDFESGKVLFIPTTHIRYDLPVANSHALDKVVIENSQGQIVKQFKFKYAYWKTLGGYGATNGFSLIPFDSLVLANESNLPQVDHGSYYRLMLMSITELDSSGNPVDKGYSFDYSLTGGFPVRGDATNGTDFADYWGYFNNREHGNYYDAGSGTRRYGLGQDLVANPWYSTTPPAPNQDNPLTELSQIFDLFCLEPTSSAVYGSLNTIHLPTGAYEQINLENNTGTYPAALSPIAPTGGQGLRVSSVLVRDSATGWLKQTTYNYEGGAAASPPVNRGTLRIYNPNIHVTQQYETLNVNEYALNDESIGYGKVTVQYSEGKVVEAPDMPDSVSKNVYYYATPATQGAFSCVDYIPLVVGASYPGYAINTPHDEQLKWRQGALIKHEFYIKDKTLGYVLKERDTTDYDESNPQLSYGIRMNPFSWIPNIADGESYAPYFQYTGTTNPSDETHTRFENGDTMAVQSFYTYTPTDYKYKAQDLAVIYKPFPDGTSSYEYFLYSKNFTGLPLQNNDNNDETFKICLPQGDPSKLIEHVSTFTKFDGNYVQENITNATFFKYTSGGDPDSIYTIRNLPLSFGNFAFSNVPSHATGIFSTYLVSATCVPDSNYSLAQKLRWNLRRPYDGFSTDVDGLSESIDPLTGDTTAYVSVLNRFQGSFLNGNSGSSIGYPSAVIKGASFSKAMSYLTPAGWTSDSAFNADINHLRSSLPQASVSSVTYRPIVGPTTITDPAGNMTYIDYDKAARPVDKKDKNGNVLQKMEYHSK